MDGVVVGADSMTTYGLSAFNVQQNNTKIRIYEGKVIVGISGSHGMSQVELDSLANHWQSEVVEKDVSEAKTFISRTSFAATLPYLELSRTLHNIQSGQYDQSLSTDLLVATPTLCSGPALLMFDFKKSVVEADENLFFLSSGSGSLMANPFLKFLDRIFWQGTPPPTINDGVFGVLWALRHVIDANATMGVGGDPHIAVLEDRGEKDWQAKLLSEGELQEHQQNINEAEQSLRNYQSELKPPLDKESQTD